MDTAQSTLNQIENPENQVSAQGVESDTEIVKWTAPTRIFKKRDRQYFVTIFAMAGIISLILFLIEGFMPVALIVSLVFLYYVMSTVPPDNAEYKITKHGIKIGDKLVNWSELIRFWFANKSGIEVLILNTTLIPNRIEIIINPGLRENIRKEISTHIPYEEMPASRMDKVIGWISEKLPGNK